MIVMTTTTQSTTTKTTSKTTSNATTKPSTKSNIKLTTGGVLQCGLHIIYGDSYRSFSVALTRANMLSVTDQLHNRTTPCSLNLPNTTNSANGLKSDQKLR